MGGGLTWSVSMSPRVGVLRFTVFRVFLPCSLSTMSFPFFMQGVALACVGLCWLLVFVRFSSREFVPCTFLVSLYSVYPRLLIILYDNGWVAVGYFPEFFVCDGSALCVCCVLLIFLKKTQTLFACSFEYTEGVG